MPHIILKIASGQSEETKQKIVSDFVEVITKNTENPEEAVSVAIEEVDKEYWETAVYDVDIKPNLEKLYKKPGYSFDE